MPIFHTKRNSRLVSSTFKLLQFYSKVSLKQIMQNCDTYTVHMYLYNEQNYSIGHIVITLIVVPSLHTTHGILRNVKCEYSPIIPFESSKVIKKSETVSDALKRFV